MSPLGAFSKGQRAECLEIFKSILRGAYATIAIIVSPLGAFSKGQRAECLEIFKSILRGLTPPSLSLYRPWAFSKGKEQVLI